MTAFFVPISPAAERERRLSEWQRYNQEMGAQQQQEVADQARRKELTKQIRAERKAAKDKATREGESWFAGPKTSVEQEVENRIQQEQRERGIAQLGGQDVLQNVGEDRTVKGLVSEVDTIYKGMEGGASAAQEEDWELAERVVTMDDQVKAWTKLLQDGTALKNQLTALKKLKGDAGVLVDNALQKLDILLERAPWSDGKKIMLKVLNGSVPKISEDLIRDFIWYLYKLSYDKGQGFEEGMWVLADHQEKIFNWLKSYPKVYQRQSTHFYEYRKDRSKKNLGIDVPGLPTNKQTILFDIFTHWGQHAGDKKYLFIKPESHGVQHLDLEAVSHAGELAIARARKYVPGADDRPEWRKERVPYAVSSVFSSIVEKANEYSALGSWARWATTQVPLVSNKLDQRDPLIISGEQLGIWKMKEIVDSLINQNKIELNDPLIARFNKACAEYDNIDIRKGREVILTEQELGSR